MSRLPISTETGRSGSEKGSASSDGRLLSGSGGRVMSMARARRLSILSRPENSARRDHSISASLIVSQIPDRSATEISATRALEANSPSIPFRRICRFSVESVSSRSRTMPLFSVVSSVCAKSAMADKSRAETMSDTRVKMPAPIRYRPPPPGRMPTGPTHGRNQTGLDQGPCSTARQRQGWF